MYVCVCVCVCVCMCVCVCVCLLGVRWGLLESGAYLKLTRDQIRSNDFCQKCHPVLISMKPSEAFCIVLGAKMYDTYIGFEYKHIS